MMTLHEARQRCAVNNCILRTTGYGDYEVYRREWTRRERERFAYFTDDLEDAALTSAQLTA